MKTLITTLLLAISILLTSCGKKKKSISEDGGAIVTVKFYDIAQNAETHENILEKLKARTARLSPDAEVYYSAIDSTYQITLPDYYSENNLKLLIAKGEINVNMLWHHSEFEKPHGKRLIAKLGEKYKINQQEVDFIIEDINFDDRSSISKYIADNHLLNGFPNGTKVYFQPPSVLGRENKLVMFLLSDSPDNFNLNVATDSSQVEEVEGRNKMRYTKMFLNDQYAEKYADVSDRNVGNQIAISIDQYVVSTPIVESRIDSGVIMSFAEYDNEGHAVFEALLATSPIKSPSEVISINILSDQKK